MLRVLPLLALLSGCNGCTKRPGSACGPQDDEKGYCDQDNRPVTCRCVDTPERCRQDPRGARWEWVTANNPWVPFEDDSQCFWECGADTSSHEGEFGFLCGR